MSPATGRRHIPRGIAPLAAGLLVVLLLGVVVTAVRAAGGSGVHIEPASPTLRLAPISGNVTVDVPASGSQSSRFRLAGTLPSSRPDAAPVYRTGSGGADAVLVRQLTQALGMAGTPVRTKSGWTLAVGHRVLMVQGRGNWAWRLEPGVITADGRVQCFRAPCPNESTLPGRATGGRPAPPASLAEQVAGKALRALDLPADTLRITTSGRLAQVRAPRLVDGLEASGFDTVFLIGGDGTIYAGNGWLGQPGSGPTYPLVSAADGFRRLQAQPRDEILLCRPLPGGGCAPTPQVTVIGGKLGLMTALDARGLVLVPAWLFTVAGQNAPVAVIAVQSRYVRPWTPPDDGTDN